MKSICKSMTMCLRRRGMLFLLATANLLWAGLRPATADIIGLDVAANYGANWNPDSNLGSGFQPWQLYSTGTGGRFIYSSTQNGAGDVNTSGVAFGLWGNPVGNNYGYARRFFMGGGLTPGQRFTVDVAPSTQAGNRGVSLLNAQTNVLWTFGAGSNMYAAGGANLGWAYALNSVFQLSVDQVASNTLAVSLTRGAQSYSTNVAGRLAGFLAFNGNNPAGGANNFYFNNLTLHGTPPPPGAINIGPGPAIGTDARGAVWFEELQEWEHRDLRALDPADDAHPINFADTGRDLVAFYSRDEAGEDRIYFRADFLELGGGWENAEVNLYVAIDCAPGGQVWFPDNTGTRTDHPWEACVAVYNGGAGTVVDTNFAAHGDAYLGSYWQSTLDAVEFGIQRSFLTARGWDGSASSLHFQVFTTRPGADLANRSDVVDSVGGTLIPNTGDPAGTGWLQGAVRGDDTAGRAKYAVIAHANQSVNARSGTQGHIFTARPDMNLYPGFVRLLDSAEMLKTPINLHLSGSLLISFLWAAQDPAETSYPLRDGPTFVARVKDFVTGEGPGSLIGGVLAEHIMPYFEGEVNAKSIAQNSALLEHLFGLTEADMKVMHVPERVIRSQTNHPWASPAGPLTGATFKEIEESGYTATYLDEVTHLHWWFHPTEQDGWTDACTCTRWAGWMGCQDEPYHHKVHKINGVYTFMINDREDFPKFWNQEDGLHFDTRRTLLGKARSADQSQVTIIFDDWEAYAGNSFASPDPNHNADQFHRTLRWLANRPWIELVNLNEVLARAELDASWVIEHGDRYDLSSQTYEWLKRASEHSYDQWYYGSSQEESFFARVPPVAWDGGAWTPPGMKMYGDMNTPGTLLRDTWDTLQSIQSPALKQLGEWAFSAMIYETAWHDEDANPNRYQSRNYQTTFNRNDACAQSNEDTTWDPISGWALKLHGHIRHSAALADVDDWLADLRSGAQGRETRAYALDVDDDTLDEYILCNNRVYLCFERWGARLVRAFVYDAQTDDAIPVIGAPITNPPNEHELENADETRCSAFKDRWSTGLASHQFVDMDFAFAAPVAGSGSWSFTSKDGRIVKTVSLWDGRDVAVADYRASADVGTLYTRFGLSPNPMDLVFNGIQNLERLSDPSFRGLRNTQGGAAFVVPGTNCQLITGSIANAGWDRREMALTEQFETQNTASNFAVAVAFSTASAQDVDADGLANTQETAIGTNPWRADTDEDGIPDGWEVAHLLNPLVQDAHLPSSSTGLSNFDKYVMNADPADSNAFLRVERLEWTAEGVRIEHNVSPPRRYQILYADGLDAPSDWRPFAHADSPVGSWLATDPSVFRHTFIDDFGPETSGGAPSHGMRSYTIRVSLPE